MFFTFVLFYGEITDTVPESVLATYTVPHALAIATGSSPTGMSFIFVLFSVEITYTVLESLLATYRYSPTPIVISTGCLPTLM